MFFRIGVLLPLVVAVREEASVHVSAAAEEEMEFKLVPAKISKAIRRSMRLTARASEEAVAKTKQAEEKAKHAEKRAEEADAALERSNKMNEELKMGAERLEKRKAKAKEQMELHSKANNTLKAAEKELEEMEKQCDAEEKKYNELKKRTEEQIRKLLQEKMDASQKLAGMKKGKEVKEEHVNRLESAAAAAGLLAREEKEKADEAEAAYKEAEEKCAEQKAAAEDAAAVAATARVEEAQAKDAAAMADQDLVKKNATKIQVLLLKKSIQAYYDVTDAMTKSMEASLEKQAEGKHAWDLMREDQNVKESMVSYNLMVEQFRRLFYENKEVYQEVADSTAQIHENAQAAWLLQCDPEEELEIEAKEKKSIERLNELCGSGLWKHFQVQRLSFPNSKSKEVPPTAKPVEETPAVEPVAEEAEKVEPVAEEAEKVEPEEPEEEPEGEVSSEEPKDPALLQVRDLDLMNKLRRRRA